jgi:hypothetical protein
MAEAIVQVTEGVGKKLHTWDRTIGANLVQDEFFLPGEYGYATYTLVTDGAVAVATANSHLLQIMAGASLNVRIRKVRISVAAQPAAITQMEFQILRLTTAGTGGGAKTARAYDNADAAAGASGLTLNTVKGAEGNILWSQAGTLFTAAIPGAGNLPILEWAQAPNAKPIIIPAGAANGIAVKNIGGVATATVIIDVEFVETAFV